MSTKQARNKAQNQRIYRETKKAKEKEIKKDTGCLDVPNDKKQGLSQKLLIKRMNQTLFCFLLLFIAMSPL